MTQLIDGMLGYIERKPGRAVAVLLAGAATILLSYWCLSGQLGEAADVSFRLALLLGAIIIVARHMTARMKTEEYAARETRAEIAVQDALDKFHSGRPLTAEDVAALKLRREGRFS